MGMMGPGGGLAGLLGIEQVQQELKLTESQKEKLTAMREKRREQARQQMGEQSREEMRKRFAELQNLSEEERQARFEQFRKEAEKRAKETEKELATILEPAQMNRLKQIERQMAGIDVLLQPEVASALGLSEEQKQQVQQVIDKRGEQMRAMFERGRDMDREARQKEMEKIRDEAQKNAMAVLTPEQKKKLGPLMGKKFELDRAAMFRGRGGPQGQGKQRPGGGEGRRGRQGQEGRGQDRGRQAQ